jgi:curved DNA-binding protein CbpA
MIDEEKHEATLYDSLNLTRSASLDDVRRAFFGLVRQCPPRTNPERFQEISAAYHILSDPRRRGEYDQQRDNGARVRVLVDQAAVCAEKDPQKAIGLLKSAVAIAPDMPRPRVLLAHVLARIDDFITAERQYRWLVRCYPNDEVFRFRLARVLWLQGRGDDAEGELQAVLRINGGYHDALSLLSRIYADRQQITEQIAILERAILNDGVENYSDFEMLVQLLMVYIHSNNASEIEHTIRRIQAVVPIAQAGASVQALCQRARALMENDALPVAREILRCAARIPLPSESVDIGDEVQVLARQIELTGEARQIDRDTLITGGIKACFQVIYLDRSNAAIRQGRMDAAMAMLQREFETDPRGLIHRTDYVRCEYPAIAADQDAFLTQVRLRAARRLTAETQTSGTSMPKPAEPDERPTEPPRRSFLGRILRAH